MGIDIGDDILKKKKPKVYNFIDISSKIFNAWKARIVREIEKKKNPLLQLLMKLQVKFQNFQQVFEHIYEENLTTIVFIDFIN